MEEESDWSMPDSLSYVSEEEEDSAEETHYESDSGISFLDFGSLSLKERGESRPRKPRRHGSWCHDAYEFNDSDFDDAISVYGTGSFLDSDHDYFHEFDANFSDYDGLD